MTVDGELTGSVCGLAVQLMSVDEGSEGVQEICSVYSLFEE